MTYYRRRLPHWHPEGALLFLTWHLAGCQPSGAGASACQNLTPGRSFVLLDRAVDRASEGPLWLKDPRVATMVAEKIHYGEHQRHFNSLHAWVIMPNHVHLLLQPLQEPPVTLRWLKGSTAREANRILGRTGRPFWQDETFDHWVRKEGERQKILRYIEWNPVTAELARSIETWPWSSAYLAGESACPTGANGTVSTSRVSGVRYPCYPR